MGARTSWTRGHWSESTAREVLRAWRASGLSMRAFCAAHGLRAQRLAWWRRRLGEWEQAGGVPKLVPVVVRESPATVAGVVVRLEGAVVEASSSEAVPAAWLGALARALRGP